MNAAVKGVVYLDLGVKRELLVGTEATAGNEMLRRISPWWRDSKHGATKWATK